MIEPLKNVLPDARMLFAGFLLLGLSAVGNEAVAGNLSLAWNPSVAEALSAAGIQSTAGDQLFAVNQNVAGSQSTVERAGNVHTEEIQPQVLFNRGNYMMEEQNYVRALETFRNIEKQGYAAGPLFYNMGISYVYLDSLGMASYYFHKSARFRSIGDQADAGITFVEDQMRNRGTYIPGLPWYAFIDQLLFDVDHSGWIVRGLYILNIGVLMLLFGWLYRPDLWLVYGGMTAALAGLLIIVLSSTFYIWSSNHARAIVIDTRVPMHTNPEEVTAAPENSSTEATTEETAPDLAYEGYTVTLNQSISQEQSGLVYIRLRNGVTGWIPETSVRIL